MKVLFMASNPENTTRLRLDREYRAVDLHLREGGERDRIELESAWAVRVEDISRELLRWRPDVVHFSGHGSPEGLVFEAADGASKVAPVQPLADLFRIVGGVQGVVLNACYSLPQAEAVRPHVRFVVGTSASISDSGAIAFSSGLYRGFSFGVPWREAVDLGKAQVGLLGHSDAAIVHGFEGGLEAESSAGSAGDD